MVFLKRQHTLVPELSKRGRHGAAVHRQIVCQLLAVQRDIKLRPSGLHGLGGQITEQLVPGGTAGHVADLPGEGQISPRQNGQQVPGEFRGAPTIVTSIFALSTYIFSLQTSNT